MVGINVPIPVPIAYHSFGGWKRSAFGDVNQHGMEGVRFWTKVKTVTQRWPDGGRVGRATPATPSSSRRWAERMKRWIAMLVAIFVAVYSRRGAEAYRADLRRRAARPRRLPHARPAHGEADRRLKRAGVAQAAFFVNPANLETGDGKGGEDRILAYVAAGHVIANHSWSHPHLSELSADAFLADVDRAEAWLRPREGHRAWFRFPFLDEGMGDKPSATRSAPG